jgi:hypothetical protein
MSESVNVGEFEQIVLLAILRLQKSGAIRATLDRLVPRARVAVVILSLLNGEMTDDEFHETL